MLEGGRREGVLNTGYLAVDLTPLRACISVMGDPIPNPLEYIKVKTG